MAMDTPRIWCAISGHGFGHLAQVAPILRDLAERIPNLVLHVVVDLPEALVREKLPTAGTVDRRNLDVGLVQTDAFSPDLNATAKALAALHADWDARVDAEAERMTQFGADLVVGDIPYLAFAAAQRAGIPSVGVASLTWDAVLRAYFPTDTEPYDSWHQQMRESYGCANLALRPAPALGDHPFAEAIQIDPLHRTAQRLSTEIRSSLGIPLADTRPLVLVTTGGLSAELPTAKFAEKSDYLWLIARGEEVEARNVYTTSQLNGFSFGDVVASADLVVTKPGYNTLVEAVAAGVPVVYVPRRGFPDESPIIEWVHRFGIATELSLNDFMSAHWDEAVGRLAGKRSAPRTFHGADQAVDAVCRFL